MKVDFNKVVKLDKENKPLWKKTIQFRDVTPEFSFDEWKAFAAENGLEWVQTKKIGKTEWDFQAHLAYWMGRVVKLQRFLLTTESVLPFCWNSMTASASDGTVLTLTEGEIASLKAIYEGVKPLYKFPFGKAEATADDFESRNYVAQVATPAVAYANNDDGFPDVDLSNGNAKEVEFSQGWPGSGGDDSDLPF